MRAFRHGTRPLRLLTLLASAALALVAAGPAVAQEPAVQTSSAAAKPSATHPTHAAPAPATTTASAKTDSATAAPSKGAGKTQDRIELETTQITGNRELPKVMYVVPWRKPELGDLAGRPPNSLLDEALSPVDRDVFRRQNRYYATLQSQAAAATSQPGVQAGPSAPPAVKDEK